jgi:hypothetical protein
MNIIKKYSGTALVVVVVLVIISFAKPYLPATISARL